MDQVHRRIGTPVLTGLRLEPTGLSVVPGSLVPERLPDLFTGMPVVVLGRYQGRPEGALVLQARDSTGQAWSTTVPAGRDDSAAPATVWARGKLRALEDRYAIGQDDRRGLEKEIVALALKFGVLCRFTAFVAVDRTELVNPGGKAHQIVQPVEVPDGWGQQAAQEGLVSACGSMRVRRARASYPASGDLYETDFEVPTFSPTPGSAFSPSEEDESLCDYEACDADSAIEQQETDQPTPAMPEAPLSKKRQKASESNASGFVGRVLDRLRRGGKDQKPNQQSTDDSLTVFLRHVRDLHQAMQALTNQDAASRLAWLRQHAAELQKLLDTLPATGSTRLASAVGEAQKALAETQPSDDRVHQVWSEVVAALAEGITEPAGGRKAFWK
jgi:hypothetical protein